MLLKNSAKLTSLTVSVFLLTSGSIWAANGFYNVTAIDYVDGFVVDDDGIQKNRINLIVATFNPLGHSGWHEHTGPDSGIVYSGKLTLYTLQPDGTCTKEVLKKGDNLLTLPGFPHMLINESKKVPLVATSFKYDPCLFGTANCKASTWNIPVPQPTDSTCPDLNSIP